VSSSIDRDSQAFLDEVSGDVHEAHVDGWRKVDALRRNASWIRLLIRLDVRALISGMSRRSVGLTKLNCASGLSAGQAQTMSSCASGR